MQNNSSLSTAWTEGSYIARRAVAKMLASTLVAAALSGFSLEAQSLQHVTYIAGTAMPVTHIHGTVSIASTDAVTFQGPSKLVIPYDHVISYESSTLKKVPVGLLTEGIWRLLAPWPEAKRLSLSYRDTDGHPQVILFEMSRGDEALLVEVLKLRVPRTSNQQIPPLLLNRGMVANSTSEP